MFGHVIIQNWRRLTNSHIPTPSLNAPRDQKRCKEPLLWFWGNCRLIKIKNPLADAVSQDSGNGKGRQTNTKNPWMILTRRRSRNKGGLQQRQPRESQEPVFPTHYNPADFVNRMVFHSGDVLLKEGHPTPSLPGVLYTWQRTDFYLTTYLCISSTRNHI